MYHSPIWGIAMNRSRFLLGRLFASLLAVGITQAGCDTSLPTAANSSPPVGTAPKLVGTLRSQGMQSVFITLATRGVPTDYRGQLQSLGAIVPPILGPMQEIGIVMPTARASALDQLPWVNHWRYGQDTDNLSSDVVPWGIANAGGNLVQSLTGNTGSHVKVGIIDSGINCGLPDLTGRVVGGFDFIDNVAASCDDYSDHGTGVAGIIAANADGSGIVGMAPGADLYSLVACDASYCYSALVASAINWAVANHVQVLNMSFANCGTSVDPADSTAAVSAAAAGIISVAAAGNGDYTGGVCNGGDPPSGWLKLPNVIGVSAMQSDFSTPSGYQYGPLISLAAPTNVTSTWWGGGTYTFTGTSASTPHVTGAVALLIKAGHTTFADVYNRLTTEAVDRGSPGKDNYYGYGSLDALSAVVVEPSASGISGCPSPITSAGTCTLSSSTLNGISPFLYNWHITYSNGVLPSVTTGYGVNSYNLQAPAGSYSIQVTVTPKENGVRTRTGFPGTFTIPVCTGGGGQQSASVPGGARPYVVGGC